jgi:hypothetical protein
MRGFWLPFYFCRSASGTLREGTLEVYLLGPIANSRQIGFRRYFNDGAEPIKGAARMLSRLLGMHLIFRKPRSVRSLELNPLEQRYYLLPFPQAGRSRY